MEITEWLHPPKRNRRSERGSRGGSPGRSSRCPHCEPAPHTAKVWLPQARLPPQAKGVATLTKWKTELFRF